MIACLPVRERLLDRRGAQLLLLAVAEAAMVLAQRSVNPLQETMRGALSLSDNQMALLQGPALSLPVIAVGIPLGLAVDRYSRVWLVRIFALCTVLGSVLTALSPNFVLLFAARCFVGLAVAAISISGYSLLADYYRPAQRGRAKAVLAIGQYGGMSAAFALGGFLLSRIGSQPEGWRWVMLCLTAPLALASVAMFAMREPPRVECERKQSSTQQGRWAELWHFRPIIVPLLLGVVMLYTTVYAVLVWAAPTLSRNFALGPDRVGAIMATGLMIGGILGPIAGGTLADLCQRTGKPSLTMSVLGVLALVSVPGNLFAVVSQVGSASVMLVVFMVFMSAVVAMGMTLFTVVVPNELRGLCLAVLTVTIEVISGMAPVAISSLSGVMGGPESIGRALALTCAGANLLAAAAFAIGSRNFALRMQ